MVVGLGVGPTALALAWAPNQGVVKCVDGDCPPEPDCPDGKKCVTQCVDGGDCPDTGEQDTGEQDTGKQDTGEQDTGKDTGEQDTGEQDTGKPGSSP